MKNTTRTSSSNPATPPPTDAPARQHTDRATIAKLDGVEAAFHTNYVRLHALLELVELSSNRIGELDSESFEAIGHLGQELLDNLHAAALRTHEYAKRLAKGGAA